MVDPAATNHTGHELELMLARKMPLATFYGEIGELPDEELIPEERFGPSISSGEFVRGETILELAYHPVWKRNVKVKYVFYALKNEAWRIPAMVLVLTTRLKTQAPDVTSERLVGALLGYTDAEIDAHCAEFLKQYAEIQRLAKRRGP
jgi:hypothetical protein